MKLLISLFLWSAAAAVAAKAAVVNHTFEVYYFAGSPDGVTTSSILGINGQFPGPTIEAQVGDTLEITVVNKMQDGQNTTIHWHGMHQRGFLFEDGTSQIAQCPLPQGASQLYRFNVTHPGTYWYHSHVNSQYTEGLFGALVVHDTQEAYRYDGEFTLTLSDWYHRSAHENEAWFLSPASRGMSPYPDSGLMNGFGRYPCPFATLQDRACSPEAQFRPVFSLQRNATYRVRVINTGAMTSFNFSIDGHILQTIEVDGIDVASPVPVHVASVAPGQRYSFLVHHPGRDGGEVENEAEHFLIRAAVRKESLGLIEGENINKYPNAMIGEVTGVLEYVDQDLSSHHPNLVVVSKEQFSHREIVPPPAYPADTFVAYLDDMDLAPLDGFPAPADVDEEFMVEVAFVEGEDKVRRASFNSTPFQLPRDKPLLMSLLEDGAVPKSSFPLEIAHGSVVQLVINNPFGSHPFHLHGHHFWVVGKGDPNEGHYDSNHHNLTLRGVKRDTVVVNEKSWAVIRFIGDNPGIWTLHCHMDWHNLSGMALTFVEAAEVFRREVQLTEEAARICKLHQFSEEEKEEFAPNRI